MTTTIMTLHKQTALTLDGTETVQFGVIHESRFGRQPTFMELFRTIDGISTEAEAGSVWQVYPDATPTAASVEVV